MNIELLKKLTLLANRNPSETEANAAARKVCKLLEQSNWQLTVVTTARSAVPPHTTTPPRSGPAYRVWKQNQEDNAKAQREAERRANPVAEETAAYWDEFFRKYTATGRAQSENRSYDEETRQQARSRTNPNSAAEYGYEKTYGTRSKGEKRDLKCKVCKQTKPTLFMGLPELFECNECTWERWHRARESGTGNG